MDARKIASWIISGFGNIFMYPAAATVICLLTGVLWATGVISLFVAFAVVSACIITFVGISRTQFVKNLPTMWRWPVLIFIDVILAIGGYTFRNWALTQHHQQAQTPEAVNKPENKEAPIAQPKQVEKSKQLATRDASAKKETKQRVKTEKTKLMERPYFVLYGPEIIKTTPELKKQFGTDYALQITAANTGRHTAGNIYTRQIIVDQNFKMKPGITDGSKGNEIAAGTGSTYHTGLIFPSEIVPSYVVFAIKYQDKEVPLQEPLSQIWCFEQPGGKAEAPPFAFYRYINSRT